MRHLLPLILALLRAACAPQQPQAPSLPAAPNAGLPVPAAAAPLAPATASAAPAAAAPAIPAGLPRGTVIHVVDGDTLDVDLGGTVERIRLIGIDTPETVKPNSSVECFGREASLYAKQLLDGQAVSIEAAPSQDTRDRYGRLLAYIWLADGTLANVELVAGGYAYEYTYDQPYIYQQQFKQAQQDAQAEQRGLWSPATCNGVHSPAGAASSAPTAISSARCGRQCRSRHFSSMPLPLRLTIRLRT